MMHTIAESIRTIFFSLPEVGRYVFVFLVSVVEGFPVIGSILPGGTIALLVGSLSAEEFVIPWLAVLCIAVGTFLGDMAGFFVGKFYGKKEWVKKLVIKECHEKSWELFDRHLALVVIFGKLLPVVRSTPSLFAALRGVHTRRYVLYSALGSLLWSFAGVYGGNILSRLIGEKAIILIIGMLVVSAVFVGVRSLLKKKHRTS
jgi:membrane protein DedA with SNARE-associated domain